MKFISTRDKNVVANSPQAILEGIAKGGGLYVPEEFPKLNDLNKYLDMSYEELAAMIIGSYFDEFSKDRMLEMTSRAYSTFPKNPAPTKYCDGYGFVELYRGRTQAFKDMALSILPYLMVESIQELDISQEVLILVATSGDTGKAALEGFKDVEGTKIIVFYPKEGVSSVQYLQMSTQEGDNTDVVAIEGNFDDAQRGVKEAFLDTELSDKLSGYKLSSANSINIGRLIPQIVYNYWSYLDLVREKKIRMGDPINVVVPTGNFGNILASYYASRMGLPINKLILAANDNNVISDFFQEGIYDSNRELLLTSSPSMDILVSSNLERFLYHISDGNAEYVKEAMESLEHDGKYLWDNRGEQFFSGYATEEDVAKSIAFIKEKYNYLIDPHTAVAYNVYEQYTAQTGDQTYTLIESTASPYKFPEKVLHSLEEEMPENYEESLNLVSKLSDTDIPKELAELKDKPIIHDKTIKPEEMKSTILEIVR